MVVATHAEPVFVDVILVATEQRLRLHVSDVQSDAPRRGRHLLEQRRNLVPRRHQAAHHFKILCVALGLSHHFRGSASCKFGLGLLIHHEQRIHARLLHVELLFFRPPQLVIDAEVGRCYEQDGNRESVLVAPGRWEECHGYRTDTASGTRRTSDGSGRV